MNRLIPKRLACTALLLAGGGLLAQENAARLAADREEAQERYNQLSSAVEELRIGQADQRRRTTTLAEALQRLSGEVSSLPAGGQFVSREEFNKLVETVREIDRKREADKRQILEEIERLGKSLSDSIQAAARRPAPEPVRVEPPREASRTEAPPADQEGVWYVVKQGNTLSTIVAAHNEAFKDQGRKTSLKLVSEANPKLKPNAMPVGQKIFVPLVPK